MSADLTDSTRVTVGLDHSERNPKASTWGALPLFYSDGTQADNLPVSQTTGADWTKWTREGTNAFLQLEHVTLNLAYMESSQLLCLISAMYSKLLLVNSNNLSSRRLNVKRSSVLRKTQQTRTTTL